MTAVERSSRIRRPKGQAEKYEKALRQIAATVRTAERYDLRSLRETLDTVGDCLVEAGVL